MPYPLPLQDGIDSFRQQLHGVSGFFYGVGLRSGFNQGRPSPQMQVVAQPL